MAQTTPLQESFSSGEISPLMYMRSDSDQWRGATSQMTNFIAKPRGPAQSRDGFRFLGKVFAEDVEPAVNIFPRPVFLTITTPQVTVTNA